MGGRGELRLCAAMMRGAGGALAQAARQGAALQLEAAAGHGTGPTLGRQLCSLIGRGTGDQASTSYASTSPLSVPSAATAAAAAAAATRGYKKHLVGRPNLASPVDVNTLDELLARSASPAAAALPVIQYEEHLNPRQVAYMLEKLPRLEQLRTLRSGSGYARDPDQSAACTAVHLSLARRLVAVMPDCTPEQLRGALWGLASLRAAGQSWGGAGSVEIGDGVADALGRWLDGRSPGDALHVAPTGAWFMAVSERGRHATMEALSLVVSAAGAAAAKGRDDVAAAAAAAAARGSPATFLEAGDVTADVASLRVGHRDLLRLAWAFSTTGTGRVDAWRLITCSAAEAMESALQAHSPASGPLSPPKLYAYRLVRGVTSYSQPVPYRPSKYRRFSGPTISVDGFGVRSVASLLGSMARSGAADARCLRAAERTLLAMLEAPVAAAGGGASPSAVSLSSELEEERLRSRAVLPGTPGALVATGRGRGLLPAGVSSSGGIGPSGMGVAVGGGVGGVLAPGGAAGAVWRAADGDPGTRLPRVADGTARYALGGRSRGAAAEEAGDGRLGGHTAARLLRACTALRHRSPRLSAAILKSGRLSDLRGHGGAVQLSAAGHCAAAMGLAEWAPMARLLAAALPLCPEMPRADGALLAAGALRVHARAAAAAAAGSTVAAAGMGSLDPALAQLLRAVLLVDAPEGGGLEGLPPGVASALSRQLAALNANVLPPDVSEAVAAVLRREPSS
ncbi:hypothetical protein FOA52_012742 [Chlamydomonas sp. UWO 241]|nr:hypothetical protein FOA52_012742 [Chlamydomonas sp. UWO 241]